MIDNSFDLTIASKVDPPATLYTHSNFGKAFGAPEQAKIKQIVAEGMTVMQEIQDLTEGLNETIKAAENPYRIKYNKRRSRYCDRHCNRTAD